MESLKAYLAVLSAPFMLLGAITAIIVGGFLVGYDQTCQFIGGPTSEEEEIIKKFVDNLLKNRKT